MKEIFIHKETKQTLAETETINDIVPEQRMLAQQREQKKEEKVNE